MPGLTIRRAWAVGSAVYDDDPIAVEPQLDEDELNGVSDETNVQEEIISAKPHKGSAD